MKKTKKQQGNNKYRFIVILTYNGILAENMDDAIKQALASGKPTIREGIKLTAQNSNI